MEIWRDIPGYEGIYQASDSGKIRTKPGKVTSNKRYDHRVWKTRVLKPKSQHTKKRKDPRVSLWKDGKCKTHLVSRLVAMTWVCGYGPGMTVNHIDGNPLNNNRMNLEWVTIAENIRKGHETGLYANIKEPIMLKCNDVEIAFDSMAEASRFLGWNSGYIHNCLKKDRPIKSSSGSTYRIYFLKDVSV